MDLFPRRSSCTTVFIKSKQLRRAIRRILRPKTLSIRDEPRKPKISQKSTIENPSSVVTHSSFARNLFLEHLYDKKFSTRARFSSVVKTKPSELESLASISLSPLPPLAPLGGAPTTVGAQAPPKVGDVLPCGAVSGPLDD